MARKVSEICSNSDTSLQMFVDRFQDHRVFSIRGKPTGRPIASSPAPVPRPDAQTRRMQSIENETECFNVKHTSISFGTRLKTLRAQKEMSQRDLALRASVKVDVIRDYENGQAIPNAQFIRRLESILGGSLREGHAS
jgi:ribosome-binding protein aMBF1 (putative translation factor)